MYQVLERSFASTQCKRPFTTTESVVSLSAPLNPSTRWLCYHLEKFWQVGRDTLLHLHHLLLSWDVRLFGLSKAENLGWVGGY